MNLHALRPSKYLLVTFMLAILLLTGSKRGFTESFAVCAENSREIENITFNLEREEFLDSGGTRYLLGNINFVKLENYSATIRKQIDKQIEELVNKFLGLDNLSLVNLATKPDRYGRYSVNLYANSERRWMQQELVAAGLAIVHPGRNSQECDALLFAAERAAGNKNKGVWAPADLIIMAANDANWQSRVQNYQLVEGKIFSVGETKSRLYLNFGKNWDVDFTVVVAKQHIKRFKKVFGDLKQLSGKSVRIRGWMVNNRGPMIEVYHPGQIEIEIE